MSHIAIIGNSWDNANQNCLHYHSRLKSGIKNTKQAIKNTRLPANPIMLPLSMLEAVYNRAHRINNPQPHN